MDNQLTDKWVNWMSDASAGYWTFIRLETMPADGQTPDDGTRYPAVYFARIEDLRKITGDNDWNGKPYYVSEGYQEVDGVSMTGDAQKRRKAFEALEELGEVELRSRWGSDIEFSADDAQFFTERYKMLEFTNAKRTPDGYDSKRLEHEKLLLNVWLGMGAFERADALMWYADDWETSGYADGCFATFREACAEHRITRDNCGDTDEWDRPEKPQKIKLIEREYNAPGFGDYLEEKTGHVWALFGMDSDMRFSDCVVCGHVFTQADEDFFQDLYNDRCVCNRPECITVRMLD